MRSPLLALALLSTAPLAAAPAPPNIVFVLADDLGIECLSSYGGTGHQTPNLDRLVAQGMRFTRCFSNPYCSPSRASLLTGRYPFAHGMKTVIWDRKRHADIWVKPDQPSFARQLRDTGYTTAIAGKWQLSFLDQRNTIPDFGFDHHQCWQIFDDDGKRTRRYHQPHFVRDGKVIAGDIADRYGPEVNVGFLMDFISESAHRKQPFLAYHTCLLPHYPWVSTPDSEDRTDRLDDTAAKGDPRYFPDMVRYLDKNVGRLMDQLEKLGIADNTVFIFAADNGTDRDLTNPWGANRSIKGGKGTLTDRGTHVPLIVRWPGKVEAGTTCDDLIDFSDFLPTLCELAGAALPDAAIHGRSFAPQLLGKPGRPREWVHVQNAEGRYVRDEGYMLNQRDELRRVGEIWEDPAPPNENRDPEKEQAARKKLQAVLDSLK